MDEMHINHLPDTDIREWALSNRPVMRIAADIAKRIKSGRYRRYQQLPPNDDIADEYGVSVRTLIRAKQLLAKHKVLAKGEGNVYIVA